MKIENMKSVDPNEVCLKDINPILQVLKKREEEALEKGQSNMYTAYYDVRHLLEDAPRIGATEFVRLETGKTIRELSEELPLHEILRLIEKLYYAYQISKERT